MAGVGPGFRIAAAFDFAEQHGLNGEAAKIRTMSIHPSITKPSAVRKGEFIKLFESAKVIGDFVTQHWPKRDTEAGKRRREQLLYRADLNRRRLEGKSDPPPVGGGEGEGEGTGTDGGGEDLNPSALFAIEAHLRDFIAGNLKRVPITGRTLTLYKNQAGRGGVEFPTAVGPIDILTVDSDGNFYVFELKLARGPDKALGQLARYMGWVRVHLADGKGVTGVIVANAIDEKLRYAASVLPGVILFEYQLSFAIQGVTPMGVKTAGPAQ